MKMNTLDVFNPQGEGMTGPYFQHNIYNMSSEPHFRSESPIPRSPRFGSLRRRKRIDREYFDDTSEGSDGRTSSDEYESSSNQTSKKMDDNNNTNQKNRKNSHFAFSNVKKKITSTFQRRHSVSMHPPSATVQGKQLPIRRSSTTGNQSPRLLRQSSFDESHTAVHKRKTSLRRQVTMAAVRLHEQSQVSGSNPMLDRILQKSQFQLESSSSTPDIKSHLSLKKTHLKTFKIHILGSKSVGKTALTVRFLTGRYIHEYKSAAEETYTRVMKYEDEEVNVKILINDIESMENDIELGQNSGIMILYSIVDRTSYDYAKFVLNYLSENNITGYYPVMLMGTKRDLSRMRQVDRKESFKVATQYNCTPFDVSSASNRRVTESFHAMFRQIEIRNLLNQNEGIDAPTIVNPPIVARSGKLRYGTA
ncbi:uncharacterized protein [Clytia hemisphaerica]|uniref:uncharacterized protein isoform X3 n=1 Tax=Clytia hemisphaerica TaxID=252671 RepID=UPI0034D4A1B5